MQVFRSKLWLILPALWITTVSISAAEKPPQLDWSAWRRIPVYHDGRIMPMDTFARGAVEIICDRMNPTLSLKQSLPYDGDPAASAEQKQAWLEKTISHPIYAPARSLFPGDRPRRFEAAELLFSWLVEPEKWNEVPFLIAEHDELRTKYLGLSATNVEGKHLRYVSPRQVEDADGLNERLEQLKTLQREARQKGETFKLSGVDKKIDELWRAYTLYRQLTLSSQLDMAARAKFQQALRVAATTWFGMADQLNVFRKMGDASGLPAMIGRADAAMKKLGELFERVRIERSEADKATRDFEASVKGIAHEFSRYHQRMQDEPPDLDADRLKALLASMKQLAEGTDRLAAQAKAVRQAIYQSGEPLCVVPALNRDALERDRVPSDTSQPWLDLETLLMSPPGSLPGYPAKQVAAVRKAFARAKATYADAANRPHDFAKSMQQFSGALRSLAMAIEPLRQQLAIEHRDEQVIAYTAYPPASFTEYEVLYNQTDPFMHAWMINLASLIFFSLSFGRIRRFMFWLGVGVLALGMGVTAYGFALRITVSGWAPVTNMYETVIYVPFVVTVLGMWFLLLPLTWSGMKNAWRLTALPGIWEALRPTESQQRLLSPKGWLWGNLLLLVPRVGLGALVLYALSIADYAAGGRKVINLLPVIDVGQRFPDFNDILTWAVGLAILLPTVWYLPRVILTAVTSLITIPWTLYSGGEPVGKRMAEVRDRWPFGFAAALVAFSGSFVAWYAPVLDESFSPLMPVLRDNFWLMIHVLTIVSSYGAGALAWGLGLIALTYYLFGRYRQPLGAVSLSSGREAADVSSKDRDRTLAGHREPEPCVALSGYIYKAMQVAVLLLAAGTILGGLWADVAWGRFWGWDPKEVWALISCLVYLALLHARYAGLIGHFGLTAGTVLGASAIAMSWYGVNFVLGQGKHSYGFGEGGQGYVYTVVALNWLFLAGAAARFYYETHVRLVPVEGPKDRGDSEHIPAPQAESHEEVAP